MKLNLGFLASHNGSNVGSIVKNIKEKNLEAKAKVVISNNPSAGVLKIAQNNNIPNYCINSRLHVKSEEDYIIKVLSSHDVNLVILAGYMKQVSPKIIKKYPNRILNIHPALLPKYGGKGMYGNHVHEAVIKSDDKESGATIHIVTPEYDKGPILGQCKVPRYENDTPDTLAKRVLSFEHVLYSQVLRDIKSGLIDLDKS